MVVISLLVAPTFALLLTATAPRCQPQKIDAADAAALRAIQGGQATVSRRAALGSLFLTPAAVFASDADLVCEDTDYECRDKQQKAIREQIKKRSKLATKKRIEDSKKGPVRKPTDLVENRRKTVDYSCVSATGSPCPTSEGAN